MNDGDYAIELSQENERLRAEVEAMKSGRTTCGQRAPGAVEFTDTTPREIAMIEQEIAGNDLMISILRRPEGAP